MEEKRGPGRPKTKPTEDLVTVKVVRGFYPSNPPKDANDPRGVKCMPGSIVEIPKADARKLQKAGVVEATFEDVKPTWITREEFAEKQQAADKERAAKLYAHHFARAMTAKEMNSDEASL